MVTPPIFHGLGADLDTRGWILSSNFRALQWKVASSMIDTFKMVIVHNVHNHIKITGGSTTLQKSHTIFVSCADGQKYIYGKHLANGRKIKKKTWLFPMTCPIFVDGRATPTAAWTSEIGSRSMAPRVQEQLSMVSRWGLWIFTWSVLAEEWANFGWFAPRKNVEKNPAIPWVFLVALEYSGKKNKDFWNLSWLLGATKMFFLAGWHWSMIYQIEA